MNTLGILERAAELRARRMPFTLATVVRAHRPTSAHTGDRALIHPDGTMEGWVGGTCAELTVRTAAIKALTTGTSTLLRITPTPQPAADAPPTPPTATTPPETAAPTAPSPRATPPGLPASADATSPNASTTATRSVDRPTRAAAQGVDADRPLGTDAAAETGTGWEVDAWQGTQAGESWDVAAEVGNSGDEAADDGLVVVANPCLSGGTLEIFLEAVLPPPLVQVHGQGPVARALVNVGTALGYDVHTADPTTLGPPTTADAPDARPRTTPGSATEATRDDRTDAGPPRVAPAPGAELARDDRADAVIVASHGRDEERALSAALRAGVPYIALVASRKRGTAVLASLDAPDADRVHTPAGLDIGARTAPEIALSIYAQLVADRPAHPRTTPRPPETAIDPVCGMTVITAGAPTRTHEGRTWWFCTPACQDAFTPPT